MVMQFDADFVLTVVDADFVHTVVDADFILTVVDADFVLNSLVFPLLCRESVKVDCKSRFALQHKTSSLQKLRLFYKL